MLRNDLANYLSQLPEPAVSPSPCRPQALLTRLSAASSPPPQEAVRTPHGDLTMRPLAGLQPAHQHFINLRPAGVYTRCVVTRAAWRCLAQSKLEEQPQRTLESSSANRGEA